MSKPLNPTMTLALEYARAGGGKLYRWPGGYWRNSGPGGSARLDIWYGTTTVEALVARGAMAYSEWKENRRGEFPIEATITNG